uniref:Uncharacterized protein n=1 Tax=Culex tarsalis TaxID=7177 RepID=A0A1Q3FZZ1_CULTA
MDSLYERCRQNKLIFTKLQPAASPEPASDQRRPPPNSHNSELEEIFNRRVPTPRMMTPSNGGGGGGRSRLTPGERDLDSDLDEEAQSELGSDIYSDAGSISRRGTTKMNRLVDLIQRDKITPTRGRDTESTPVSSPQLTSPNVTLTASAETIPKPKLSTTSVTDSPSKLGKIYDTFYWNVLTLVSVAIGFVLTELVFKQTIKLLQLLKDPIERQLGAIWGSYLVTLGTTEGPRKHAWFGRHLRGFKVRGIELEYVLTVAIMIPTAAFLLVAYALVWILYILNLAMLTEIQLF